MPRNNFVFHPLTVITCAGLGVIAYALLMRWRFPGGDLSGHFIYVLPILVPFVSFLFDRLRQIREVSWREVLIDVVVVVTAVMRMIGEVPFVSGHALLLSYAIARPGSRLTRILAALVMLQVLYLKLFVWHDMISPVLGIIVGVAAATIVRQVRVRNHGLRLWAPVKR